MCILSLGLINSTIFFMSFAIICLNMTVIFNYNSYLHNFFNYKLNFRQFKHVYITFEIIETNYLFDVLFIGHYICLYFFFMLYRFEKAIIIPLIYIKFNESFVSILSIHSIVGISVHNLNEQ